MKRIVISLTILSIGLVAIHLGARFLLLQPFQDIKSLNFGVWSLPAGKTDYILSEESISFDENAKVLTFEMNGPNERTLTFTEQAVPESVSGQTDIFELQLKSLPEVAKFDSINGSVSITHPTGTDQATAIMRSKGTLLLVHSNKQMSIENWRQLFNKMEIKI